ncbi:MAG: Asp-tRNA(Asn)/Glu-tRNA(Gln) amidotransferase subunit GatC [Patescibacteria group bacterium]
MTRLTDQDILKLARLSRLSLSSDEVMRFKKEIEAILNYVEQLQKVKLDELQPSFQVNGLKNVTRPDAIVDYGYDSNVLLDNAPATKDGQIKVKRMID